MKINLSKNKVKGYQAHEMVQPDHNLTSKISNAILIIRMS